MKKVRQKQMLTGDMQKRNSLFRNPKLAYFWWTFVYFFSWEKSAGTSAPQPHKREVNSILWNLKIDKLVFKISLMIAPPLLHSLILLHIETLNVWPLCTGKFMHRALISTELEGLYKLNECLYFPRKRLVLDLLIFIHSFSFLWLF